ncbi:MAG: hypothetical protein NUV57_03825 [archaeon]|nr:hypothetical protein [archaeon]
MLKIDATFTPFRLNLKRKEPVTLKLNIRNMNDVDVLMSYEVLVSRSLSIDKGGFKTSESKRVGKMEPGQIEEKYLDIYPKGMAREGNYPIIIKAMEHYQNYNFVEKEYKKKLELKVDE